jgi:hypothetical protein
MAVYPFPLSESCVGRGAMSTVSFFGKRAFPLFRLASGHSLYSPQPQSRGSSITEF